MAGQERSQEAVAGEGPAVDRAVVLVHGIGSQARGTVLSGWVQEVLDFVQRTGGMAAQLDRVHSGADGPAWADLVLGQPAGATTPTTRVRIYEAFWADVIRPPSYGALVRWAASVLPKVVSHHLLSLVMVWPEQSLSDLADTSPAVRLRGLMRGVATIVLLPLMLLALTFGAALGLAAVVAVWVFGVVALVPGLRGPAGSLQKVIAASVGDTAYITTNDVQRAYVVDRVKQAIRAATDDVAADARITVVAHSQGAAVAYYALTEGTPPRRPLELLTFGQGLAKVERIRVPLRDAWYVTVPYAMSLVTMLAGWWVVRRDAVDGLADAAVVVGLGVVPLLVLAGLALAWRVTGSSSPDAGIGWVAGAVVLVTVLVGGWGRLVSAMAMAADTAAVVLVSLLALAMFLGAIQLWRHARTPEVDLGDGADAEPPDRTAHDNAAQRERTSASHGLRVHLAWPSTLTRWTDLWATSDPVPGGALRRPAGAPEGAFTSRSVVNHQSILSDHTGYWDNHQQFVTAVVDRMVPDHWELRAGEGSAAARGEALRRTHGLVTWYARAAGYTAFLAYGLLGPPIPLALPLTLIPESIRERVAAWTAMSDGRLESLVMVGVLITLFRLVSTAASTRLMTRRWRPRLQVGRLPAAMPAPAAETPPAEAPPPMAAPPMAAPPMAAAPAPGAAPDPDGLEVVFYLDGTPVYAAQPEAGG